MPHTEASPRLIILIIFCLYLPFMESLHGATLWGLSWQSPALMDATKGYLKLVKLVMVLVAAYLMAFKYQIMQNTIRHGVLRAVFVISTWMLVVVQIRMLLLGILFGEVLSAPADYMHREQKFGNDTVRSRCNGKSLSLFLYKMPRASGTLSVKYGIEAKLDARFQFHAGWRATVS